ncbi:glutathione synthase [Synechococcus sp. PCC 7336]|uniref:glutathione synthase n=1 Tax=Synechococcus sp. PCC 7336 TaxID=195250 RepID=UPI0003481823|nr:glutathione synthase [Synechococcus sp. PCC 7336]
MRIAFVVDPLDRLQPHHDTSVALMESLQARGHEVYALEQSALYFASGSTWATVSRLQLNPHKQPWYVIAATERLSLSQMDAVWMRKDPPVDAAYVTATQLLDAIGGSTLVLNDPAGLLAANEKLFALQFDRWTPETVVTQDKQTILDFVGDRDRAVLKPLDGKGGEGIFVLHAGDRNLKSLIEVSTQFGQKPVMVQEYLPAAARGDKRILLLDGKPLGAVNRIPGQGDFRGNVAAGGSVEAVEMTDRERQMCEDLAPVLRQSKLYFVGIDVIGECLTEVNVTSPTMLKEIAELNHQDLGAEVADWLERKLQE